MHIFEHEPLYIPLNHTKDMQEIIREWTERSSGIKYVEETVNEKIYFSRVRDGYVFPERVEGKIMRMTKTWPDGSKTVTESVKTTNRTPTFPWDQFEFSQVKFL